MGTTVDDVDLARLLENVRYLTKRATIHNELRDRILSALNTFENLMSCDINMAFDMARDLTIIRALIKKESEDLERKFGIFDRKLRKFTNAVLSKEEREEDESSKCYRVLTTLFQDNDIRIIDTISRVSALSKLEECREMLCLIKEAMRLADTTDFPISIKSLTFSGLSDVIRLLKIDGGLALKLKKDILEIRSALKSKCEASDDLQNAFKILKLKIQKCKSELDRKQDYFKKLKVELDENTERAMAYLEESVQGINGGDDMGWKRKTKSDLLDNCLQGTVASRKVPEQVQQSPTTQGLPPIANGWLLTPIDPNFCQLPIFSPLPKQGAQSSKTGVIPRPSK